MINKRLEIITSLTKNIHDPTHDVIWYDSNITGRFVFGWDGEIFRMAMFQFLGSGRWGVGFNMDDVHILWDDGKM